jgi:trehalose-6-phosphatase
MPREIPAKGAAVCQLLEDLPASTIAMYFGDDEADEEAFANLPGQITVKVGGNPNTRARYYLRSPGEVVRCLFRLERELT